MCQSDNVRALVEAPLPAAVIPSRSSGSPGPFAGPAGLRPFAYASFSTPGGWCWGLGPGAAPTSLLNREGNPSLKSTESRTETETQDFIVSP